MTFEEEIAELEREFYRVCSFGDILK